MPGAMMEQGDPGILREGEVHVWLLPAGDEPPGAELLPAAERARAARYRREGDRRLFTTGRVALRALLSRHAPVRPADWTFRENAFGRPEVDGPPGAAPPRFNVSHADGLVALALARGRDVGVDVERVGGEGLDPAVARGSLSPAELDALLRLPEPERSRRFLELWTLKEAYVKALGVGHSLPVARVSFAPGGPRPTLTDAPGEDPAAWRFHRIDAGPEHVAALAVRGGGDDPAVVVRRATLASLLG